MLRFRFIGILTCDLPCWLPVGHDRTISNPMWCVRQGIFHLRPFQEWPWSIIVAGILRLVICMIMQLLYSETLSFTPLPMCHCEPQKPAKILNDVLWSWKIHFIVWSRNAFYPKLLRKKNITAFLNHIIIGNCRGWKKTKTRRRPDLLSSRLLAIHDCIHLGERN
jgi:hypothetical protein